MTKSKYNQGLHRKEGEDREEHDYYATHPSAVPPLLKILGWETGGKLIRENSCGAGHLSRVLEMYGHTVVSSDLIDRGYGITGIDYLEPNILDGHYDATVMNPPYKYARQFIEKALTQSDIVCAFLRLTFLESEGRRELFQNTPLKTVAVFSKRIPSSKNGLFPQKESSSVAYAWYIWDNSYTGEPVIKWI